jgi:Flp pilus assembly pilin Flp
MQRLRSIVRRLTRPDDGQDLLEYGVLMALIAVFAMTAVGALGLKINSAFWQLIVQNL